MSKWSQLSEKKKAEEKKGGASIKLAEKPSAKRGSRDGSTEELPTVRAVASSTKTQRKPESKPAAKQERKAEPRPEPELKQKPAAKPEPASKQEVKPVARQETKPRAAAEEPAAKQQVQPKAEPKQEPAVRSEPRARQNAESQPASKPKPKVDGKPVVRVYYEAWVAEQQRWIGFFSREDEAKEAARWNEGFTREVHLWVDEETGALMGALSPEDVLRYSPRMGKRVPTS